MYVMANITITTDWVHRDKYLTIELWSRALFVHILTLFLFSLDFYSIYVARYYSNSKSLIYLLCTLKMLS